MLVQKKNKMNHENNSYERCYDCASIKAWKEKQIKRKMLMMDICNNDHHLLWLFKGKEKERKSFGQMTINQESSINQLEHGM